MGWDTIIVGAGSAGCVLAARLSEDAGHRVLLLEAGPDFDPRDLPEQVEYLGRGYDWPIEWGEKVVSSDGRSLAYLRGRGVGGSSSINGGVAMRAEPPDFDAWPTGWSWGDMLPWFCELENDLDFGDTAWHGDSGPVRIVRWPEEEWAPTQQAFYEGCLEEGLLDCADHNAPDTTGVGPIPMNRDGGRRLSAALTHLAPARDRSNLKVRGDALVQRVTFSEGAARGVELADGERLEADRVILASGVLQSPLLLCRSGIGPAAALRALDVEPLVDSKAVGAHWTDHMVVQLSVPIEDSWVGSGVRSIQTLARVTAEGSPWIHDLQLTPWLERGADSTYQLNLSISLQQPFGEARVSARSADASDRGLFDWPFPAEPRNIERLRFGYRLGAQILSSAGLSANPSALESILGDSDEAIEAWIAQSHDAFYHGVGTCRMAEDGESVTDPECRVRGTTGLYVIDASTIPRVPRSNTHILVVALAERAAALLEGRASI